LILGDLAKVLYAPHKAFKQIVQNPKYLGAIIVLIIFVVAQLGFQYAYYSKVYYEGTTPDVNNLGVWTQNSTLWSSNAAISNNTIDVFNATNSLYGTSSLQFDISNSSTTNMAIRDIGTINCGPSYYQNFSIRIKIASPSDLPQSVNLTMYSNSDANYFRRDLTSTFTTSTIGLWNNLTIPVGSSASGWQNTGNANWLNITFIKLDFGFSNATNIEVRLEGMFFRGMYQTAVQSDSTGFLVYVLQLVFTQFLFEWLILAALMYIVIKVLKGNLTWKPLFISVGFALVVMVVQSVISAAATPLLPNVYLPVELITNLQGEALPIVNAIASLMADFNAVSSAVQLAVWVWLGALGAFITRALVPEFSWGKCIGTAAASLVVAIILLRLLIGV
jgi:hypothetical protein